MKNITIKCETCKYHEVILGARTCRLGKRFLKPYVVGCYSGEEKEVKGDEGR